MTYKSLIPYNLKAGIYALYLKVLRNYFPKRAADQVHMGYFGRKIDWKNPKTINEKINWLKFNSDTSMWTLCADKYRVRDFVTQRELADILVPLYALYKNAKEIEYDKLPDKFVLKCNHGCGDCILIHDKNSLDQKGITKKLNSLLSKKYDHELLEPHYYKIPPLIIAEQLLEDPKLSSGSAMIDYKIWCFDGKPYCIMVLENRTLDSLDMSVFDLNWEPIDYAVEESIHYHKPLKYIERPANLEAMLNVAAILSNGFPQVRVDLYNIEGKIYFGEMTFTSAGGFMAYYSERFLKELGDQIKLP